MKSHFPAFRAQRGVTLVELMVAIGIIAILVTLAFPSYQMYLKRAERLQCMANLRKLCLGFKGYVDEHGQWPQAPQDMPDNQLWKWWREQLEPYGVAEKDWRCPTYEKKIHSDYGGQDIFPITYIPMEFGPGRYAPYEYKQPWLLEVADFHGKGNLLVLPDGAVLSANQMW